jgi:hypothetical protein
MSFVNSIPSTVIVISITVSGEHMEVQRSLESFRIISLRTMCYSDKAKIAPS